MARTARIAAPAPPLLAAALLLPLLFLLAGPPSAVAAGRAGAAPPPSSYNPAPGGIEGRWVAEEEFHGASSLSSAGDGSWWDDDDGREGSDGGASVDPPPRGAASTPAEPVAKSKSGRRHRLRVWKNRPRGKGATSSPKAKGDDPAASDGDDAPASDYDEEHPLRTDEWALDVRLSRLRPTEERDLFPECLGDEGAAAGPRTTTTEGMSSSGRRRRQVMQFATNGYVKVLSDDGGGKRGGGKSNGGPRVGKWRMGHAGVAFDVPVPMPARRRRRGSNNGGNDDGSHPGMTVLRYRADIHLNKFGERPRMFRGTITRDRQSSFLPPHFLRPVVGTFSAEGIGRDTADVSYSGRAISLSRQQAIDDAKGRESFT